LPLTDTQLSTQDTDELKDLLDYLKRSRGFDFSAYKKTTLVRRIQRRMSATNAASFAHYREVLEAEPEEFAELFDTFLINVTTFFRDGEPWEFLSSEILPRLLADKRPTDPVRVWSAGCATGEEPFTIAMILAESMGLDDFRDRVKIYATDVDEHALTIARQASYDSGKVESVPPAMLDRYFERVNGNYVLLKDLRRAVVFGRHDILQDAPISRVDLLVCRNTLMYFNAEAQAKIIARLHFSLADGGFLLLGRAETLLAHTSTFRAIDLKQRLFSKIQSPRLNPHLYLMATESSNGREAPPVDDDLRDQALNTTGVAQLVIDTGGRLVLANEFARSLFGISDRDIGTPFHSLELSYRPVELRSLIDRATAELRHVVVPPSEFRQPGGDPVWLQTQVIPLSRRTGGIKGVSIIFTDVSAQRRLQQALERTSLEFESTAEQLQSANEELETTNEELQSAVEELETTNEELQASYEELETMNEELQSTNEELQAMNDVARTYTRDLDTVNHLLESIFTGLGGRVIVIDRELTVIYWNKGAEELWGIRSDEAVHAPLAKLDFGLPVESLILPIDRVLAQKSARETVHLAVTNRRGRAVECEVTIAPLMSPEGNDVDGVIIITSDSSADDQQPRLAR
jgi:two-component system, chemotaxis family, CheB/CheR fusion protein